jgi:hypothetical protein
LGEPASPSVALRSLGTTLVPPAARQWLADEMKVRYGIDIPYVPDLLVERQTEVFAMAKSQIDNVRFRPGGWTLAGREV